MLNLWVIFEDLRRGVRESLDELRSLDWWLRARLDRCRLKVRIEVSLRTD